MADPKVLEKRLQSAQKQVSLVARAPEAKAVSVSGDFTQWSLEGIPLTKDSSGDWRLTLKLAPGEYQYRLRIDGQWQDHAEAQKRVPNPFGTQNCVLSIGKS